MTKKAKKIALIIIPFFSILGIGCWYALKEYNRKPLNMTSAKAKYEFADSMLIREFENNFQGADRKYSGEIISVNGIVKKISQKEHIFSIMIGNAQSTSSILCSIDGSQKTAMLKEGNAVVIKGVYVGFNHDDLLGTDVILNRCVLINQ